MIVYFVDLKHRGDLMRLLPVVLCLLLIAGASQAAIIQVPGTASTIQAAIDMAGTRDTIVVGPGNYQENLNFKGKGLVLMSSDGPDVTTLVPAAEYTPTINFSNYEPFGTTVTGFTLSGGRSEGSILINWGAHPTIQENIFSGYIGDYNSVVIKISTDTCLITHNVFYNNGGISCVGIWGGSAAIVNNTFYHNARGFFSISGAGVAINNIVMNSTEYGVAGSFTRLQYNDVYGNYPNYSGATPGLGSISVDPLFTSASTHDFTLMPTSPCIDAGDPNSLYNDPDGTRSDMGAGHPSLQNPPAALSLSVGPTYYGVVNSLAPQIRWSYRDTSATTQQGYEVEVGTDGDWTTAEIWQSGQVMSADSQVLYTGPALHEHSVYFVRARVYNGTVWGAWYSRQIQVATFGVVLHVPSDYTSIVAAVAGAFSRDTIVVAPGRYRGNVRFSGKLLRLVSEKGADSTTIEGTLASTPAVSMIDGEPVGTELSGFTITLGTQSGIKCVGSSPRITNCNIVDNQGTSDGGGIVLKGCSKAVIRGNLLRDNPGGAYAGAIQVSPEGGASANDTICFNRIMTPSETGIRIGGPASNCAVFNNTIVQSSYYGIYVTGAVTADIRNNIVAYGTSYSYGMANYSSGSVTVEYNCLSAAYGNIGIGSSPTNLLVDPQLADVASGNLRLKPESPCIDAGDPDSRYDDPDGTRNDMGALPMSWSGSVYVKKLLFLHEDMMHVVSHTPVISWGTVVPPDAPQDSIELQIGASLNWDYTKYWRPGKMAYTDTSLVYGGKPLTDGTICYARLRIHSDTIWSEWYTMSFRMNTAPTWPMLYSPDRAEIQQGRPWFYMNGGGDVESDPLTYDFQLHVDSPTGPVVDSLIGFTLQGYWPSIQSNIEVQENKIYWWSARAFDGFEYSDWAPSFTFWVNSQQEAPAQVQAYYPPTLTGEPVVSLLPHFQWSPGTDPDPYDTVLYKFELSLGPTFTLSFVQDNIETNELDLPDSLNFDGHYWWRVSVRDNHGLGSTSMAVDFWTWMVGDINHSHMVDLGDLSAMIYYLTVNRNRISDVEYADVNADCLIDLRDLSTMIAYLTGRSVTFQAGCGSPHPLQFVPKPLEKETGKTEAGVSQ